MGGGYDMGYFNILEKLKKKKMKKPDRIGNIQTKFWQSWYATKSFSNQERITA